MEIQETFLPLSADERKELKKQSLGELPTLVFTLLAVIGLVVFIMPHLSYFWIFPVSGWMFNLVKSVRKLQRTRRDLRINHKKSLCGQITAGNKTKGDSEFNPAKYFLTIGNETIEVGKGYYNVFSVGDYVEIQYAPHSKTVFSIRRADDTLFPATPDTTMLNALDKPDEAFISWQKRKRLVRKMIPALGIAAAGVGVLTWLAPADVPFYKLASAGVLGLLAYAPSLAEAIRSLRKDLKWGHKKVITTRIESKFSNLRPQPRYYVQIKGEAIEVPQDLFARLSPGDDVYIHKTAESDLTIRMKTADGEVIKN